jgi:Flp pilus assembly protein TadG
MKSPQRDRRRAVAGAWVAMFALLMTMFVGLAIDTSYYVYSGQQLQNIADAASMAGAIVVRDGVNGDPTSPIQLANDWAIATAAANTVAHQSPDDTAFTLEPNYENTIVNADIQAGNWDRETGVFTLYDPLNPPPPQTGPYAEPLSHLPNAVRVAARKTVSSSNPPLPLLFGPIVGHDTADIEKTSIAMIGGTNGAGLIVLNPNKRCALRMGGNVNLDISAAPDGEAGIQVNSDNRCASCAGGSVTVQAGEMNVVGDTCFNGDPDLNVEINTDQPYVDDPLANLAAPTWNPALDLGCVPCGQACSGGANDGQACESDADCGLDGLCTDGVITACDGGEKDQFMCSTDADCPSGDCVRSESVILVAGYYSGGIRATSSNTTVTCLPGVYVVDNIDGGPASGLYINGGNLYANQVMFYINGQGVVFLGGNGNITITPSNNLSDPYWGISIFQARNNSNPADILGTNNMDLQGTYYFPRALLRIAGTPLALGNQIIAWEVWMQGNSQFVINYDGRFQLPGFDVMIVD